MDMIRHDFKGKNTYFVLFSDRKDNIPELLRYTVYEDTSTVFGYPNEMIIAEIFRVPCRVVVLILHTINSIVLSI